MNSKDPLQAIVLDVRNVSDIDGSAVQSLMELVNDWKQRKVSVCFVKLKAKNQEIFWRSGLMSIIGIDHIFASTKDAVAFLEGRLKSYSSYHIAVQDSPDIYKRTQNTNDEIRKEDKV